MSKFWFLNDSSTSSFVFDIIVDKQGWVRHQCREMEYIERASFVEIYGLKIASPISKLTKF